MCSFIYGRGLQPAGVIQNNLACDAQSLLIFHVQPANQSTITGVDLCHKKVGRPWFTEKCAIPYQPFVSVHNAAFHSQCDTIHKCSNKTCENNIILPTNIRYLKIYVRKWIRSQTSHWHTNTMKYTPPPHEQDHQANQWLWFVFLTPDVDTTEISCSGKVPRKNFDQRVGWSFKSPQFFKYREVHDAEYIVSILEIVEMNGTKFVSWKTVCIGTSKWWFSRALWFHLAECVGFVLNVLSGSWYNHA
jgi:hypothetical protein